jgi:hypothetical protein
MKHLSTASPGDPARRTTASGRHRRVAALVAAVTAVALVGVVLTHDDGGDAGAAAAGRPTPSSAPVTTSPAHHGSGPALAAAPTPATPAADASAGSATPAAAAPASPAAAAPAATRLPTSPEGYASAAFDAWTTGNDRRLEKLATGPVADFLEARTHHERGEWSGPACEGAAGSTYCAWTQPNAELVLRVGNEAAAAGRKHAVVEAFFTVPPGAVAVWPFTTAEEAANAQAGVDQGHQPWLLDAASVTVAYAQAELGWQDAGIDEVQPSLYRVTEPASGAHADLTLAQPVRQGSGGIWAVVRAGSTPVG